MTDPDSEDPDERAERERRELRCRARELNRFGHRVGQEIGRRLGHDLGELLTTDPARLPPYARRVLSDVQAAADLLSPTPADLLAVGQAADLSRRLRLRLIDPWVLRRRQ
jgi:hypothetical protein